MGLALTEKEHWRKRISQKIDQKIERLIAENDSTFLEKLSATARELAIKSLGFTELCEGVKKLEAARLAVERQEDEFLTAFRSKIEGVSRYTIKDRVELCITERARAHEMELLSQSSLGQEILKLRREKDELMDTIWLATSGRQIRELWSFVSQLVTHEPTPLQTVALNLGEESD